MRDLRRLMTDLADALGRILPDGFSMSASDRNIIVRTPNGYDWLNIVDNVEDNFDMDETVDEVIESVLDSKLDELQDIVTEYLTEPWPRVPGAPRSEFAPCGVEVRDGVVEIWFGDRNAPLMPTIRVELHDRDPLA